MKKLSSKQIRDLWIEYFKGKGHTLIDPVSLVPVNDPTLLWINSGVAGLKKFFDGSIIPSNRRMVNCQRAIRTNDIENVGVTARHHTFFEMLGYFSIGDYFKKEAIAFAFEFLTSEKYMAIDKEKLYMTYYPSDLETKKYWMDLGVAENHLIAQENNFWEIGNGPCGPDTEIFYDRGLAYDQQKIGIKLLAEDMENDRYVEIWNIVFSQYNAEEGVQRKDYQQLPQKNIDTGAGFERLVCISQGAETNFDTDLFMPIIKKVEADAAIEYNDNKKAYRIIADHLRAIVFAISDGALFSNEGRGYVLRRLLRRAVRYLREVGINQAYLYTLIPIVKDIMGNFYPNLAITEKLAAELIMEEEKQFHKTLKRGLVMMQELIANARNNQIDGEAAFRLYDTYGFPLELTIEMANEHHLTVDKEGFNHFMKMQKEIARSAAGKVESMESQNVALLKFTDKSLFIDSNDDKMESRVIAIFDNNKEIDQCRQGEKCQVILDKTIFYAESGGQLGDRGKMYHKDFLAEIIDCQKAPNGQHLHSIKIIQGKLAINSSVTLELDKARRERLAANHSATHLLQSALRTVLGETVRQSGSAIDDERLRFDFTFHRKLTRKELNEIELLVNKMIEKNQRADIIEMALEEAKKNGFTMLFSEKYHDYVRSVAFGSLSKELCGGSHVQSTGDIRIFVISSESSISSGIRRIEAHTGMNAYNFIKSQNRIFDDLSDFLGAESYLQVSSDVKSLSNQLKKINETNNILIKEIARAYVQTIAGKVEDFKGFKLIKEQLNVNKECFMLVADSLKSMFIDYLFVLVNESDDNFQVIIAASDKAIASGYSANQIMRMFNVLGIRGGGNDKSAQGGGKSSKDAVRDLLKGLFK